MNVFITGADSGLGQKLASVFRLDGHHTVIGTTHESKFSRDPELMYFEADCGQEGIDRIRDSVVQQFGEPPDEGIDVLINNAGTNAICPFEALSHEFIRHIMYVNFLSPVMLTQALLPWFKKPGVVVNIISDAAWRPMRHSLAYNCSKAAFDMATRQMARELTKPQNMSIIGIRPGKMVSTGMSNYIDKRVQEVRGWTPEQAMEYFRSNSVSGLELHPIDVAMFVHNVVTSGLVRQLSGACIDLVG